MSIQYPKNIVEVPFRTTRLNVENNESDPDTRDFQLGPNVYAYLTFLEWQSVGFRKFLAERGLEGGFTIQSGTTPQTGRDEWEALVGKKIKVPAGTKISYNIPPINIPSARRSPSTTININARVSLNIGENEFLLERHDEIRRKGGQSTGTTSGTALYGTRFLFLLEEYYLPIDNLPAELRAS